VIDRSMRIQTVEARPFEVPLFAPFGVATGAQDLARNVLVTLTLEDGTRGYGEAAPFPAINGETQEHALAAIEAAKSALLGESAGDWRRLAQRVAARASAAPSARCALETAILDAFTRARGVSLVDFFGGAERELRTDMTITTGSVKQAEKDAKAALEKGLSTLKVKIGGVDVDVDLERITRIRAVAPDSPLILDGNCSAPQDRNRALRATGREG
jgi:L-Ala-D/L-Glu epimerase